MSTPDQDTDPAAFTKELTDFSPTLSGPPDRSPLLTRLRFAAELLADTGKYPEVPFLGFRRKDRSVSVQPIGISLSVGRQAGCDLVFADDAKLSGRHLRVVASDKFYFLEDAGSTNGTYVNDSEEKVQRRELRDGDLIFAGNQILLFVNPTRQIDARGTHEPDS
jgi:pSer/pThr/pTyr-binding forkhead associated (FHA) protein